MLRMLTNWRVLFGLVVVGGLLGVALWPTTLVVDLATIARGPLVVTVDEEGRTRVRERFVVSTPVAGRILRIGLEPGDPVKRDDVVARIQPESAPLLDERTRAEARATIDAAGAVVERAQAEEGRARAALAQAEHELTRSRKLAAAGALPVQEADMREADVRSARETVNAAASAVRAAAADLTRSRARLGTPSPRTTAGIVSVRAPIDGVVLRRLRESESAVPAGEPLFELGDPRRLEIVADLLSTSAVQVRVGARATIEQWGEDSMLGATVRRIEPSGFTKISALGVEEQRVNVILELSDPAACAGLGDGYRVDVRIVIWEATDVLKVPTSALFRVGEQWAVYTVTDGRARRTPVEIGRQTGREAEIRSGLSESARVVVHPGDLVHDGARVTESPRAY